MAHPVSDGDVGKRVEDGSGTALGYVVAVEDGTPYVETEPDLADSIRAALGWSGDETDAVPVSEEAVAAVTDEVVRLRANRSASHEDGDTVIDRDEGETVRTVGSSADADAVPVDTDEGSSDESSGRTRTDDHPSSLTGGEATEPDRGDASENRDLDADVGDGSTAPGDAHQTDLDLARAELTRASDAADAPVQEHLHSLIEGIFEERSDGEDASPPKVDRIAELAEKLDGLTDETTGDVRERIRRSRDLLRDYLDDRRGAG